MKFTKYILKLPQIISKMKWFQTFVYFYIVFYILLFWFPAKHIQYMLWC